MIHELGPGARWRETFCGLPREGLAIGWKRDVTCPDCGAARRNLERLEREAIARMPAPIILGRPVGGSRRPRA